MNLKALFLNITWFSLLLIIVTLDGAAKHTARATLKIPSHHSMVTRAGTIKFATGETRRFVTISGVRDCSYDKHEVQPGKLILGLFPLPTTPQWVFVPLEKVTNIKFTKIFKQYDGGGSTGTTVEITLVDGKKETFEARLLNIQVDLADSIAAAQYTHYQLWGGEITFDQGARTR